MCMVHWVIRKSEIGPERAPLSEKDHSIEEKKWKMPSPAEWMNTWVSLWTFGCTAWITASAKSTLNSLQVSKGYNKTGRVISFKMHRLGWGMSRRGYYPHKECQMPMVNIFTCPIVIFVHRDISVTTSVLIRKDVVGVSLHVFNQRTMLSSTSLPLHLFLVSASQLRQGRWMAPLKRWKSAGANVVKKQPKRQGRQREGMKRKETKATKKKKSLVEDLKKRHQYVWAVLNNLLLPDQTLFN